MLIVRRCTWLLLISLTLCPLDCYAQVTLSHAQPAAIMASGQTRLNLIGDKFAAPLRVWSNAPVKVSVLEVTPNRVTVDVEPQGGPVTISNLAMMVATADSISGPIVLAVDELPSLPEAADNHAPATAQPIGINMAIDGTSDGKQLDYFRFHADRDQAITFEVLTNSLGSACDPVVRLLTEDGHVIRNIDDDAISPESRFRHSFAAAGNYLLEVHDNRFSAGGRYRLRLGNFPLVRFAYPAYVECGKSQALVMAGPDREQTSKTEVLAPTDPSINAMGVLARFTQGGSPATTMVKLTSDPQFQEIEPNNKVEESNAISGARGINGLLEQPGDRDFFKLAGVKDQTWRISAKTRSFGSSTMLKMILRNAAGEVVGKTTVNDTDEWEFDVKFAADGDYMLEVTDLLGRGGPDHGYHIDVGIAAPFTLALKPDAKTRDRFAIQPTAGAAALDLVIGRVWNNGPIELQLQPTLPGLSIVNPVIPADAKEAKIFLTAGEGWNPQTLRDVRLVGKATQAPEGNAYVGSQALHVVRSPHIAYPPQWQDGLILFAGVNDQPAFFEVNAPADPVPLPRSLADGSVNLTLKRVQADFKEPVYLVKSEVPPEWSASHKLDKDTLTLSVKHPTAANAETATLKFWWFGQWNDRGQVFQTTVNCRLFDPLKITMSQAAPVKQGEATKVTIEIVREGGEPQPVTVKLTNLPAGVTAPESITIAPTEAKAEVMLTVAADAAIGKAAGIVANAMTKLGDKEVNASSAAVELEVIAK